LIAAAGDYFRQSLCSATFPLPSDVVRDLLQVISGNYIFRVLGKLKHTQTHAHTHTHTDIQTLTNTNGQNHLGGVDHSYYNNLGDTFDISMPPSQTTLTPHVNHIRGICRIGY